MRPAVARQLWVTRLQVFGEDHPVVRASFGRYVAAIGGTLTLASAGEQAYVAWRRAREAGYANRSIRAWDRGA